MEIPFHEKVENEFHRPLVGLCSAFIYFIIR